MDLSRRGAQIAVGLLGVDAHHLLANLLGDAFVPLEVVFPDECHVIVPAHGVPPHWEYLALYPSLLVQGQRGVAAVPRDDVVVESHDQGEATVPLDRIREFDDIWIVRVGRAIVEQQVLGAGLEGWHSLADELPDSAILSRFRFGLSPG